MRSCATKWPWQYTLTIRSRGNERREIDFVCGSARTSINVSERPVRSASGPLRLSVPITSAVVGAPGSATSSSFAAALSIADFGATATMNSWVLRYAAPAAPPATIRAARIVQRSASRTIAHTPRFGGSGWR